MPWFAAALPYISAGVAAYGAYQQGQASRMASIYNSIKATQDANIARSEGDARALEESRALYMRVGALRATSGKGGNAAGSVLDVIGDEVTQGTLAIQRAQYAGELKARGYNMKADLETAAGESATKGSYLAVGRELLTGYVNANKEG